MEQKKKKFIWPLLITFVGFGIWGMAKLAASPGGDLSANIITLLDADWVKGDRNGTVILVEYGDFQCPACAAYYPLVEQILKDYEGQIAFVYRHFPLPQHRWAKTAAYAAEAAGQQGKFWDMYTLIYTNQDRWKNSSEAEIIFESYAKDLGLNPEQYGVAVDSKVVKEKVEADYQGGKQSGINATPTFLLNGKKIQPGSYEEFKQSIDDQLH